MGIEIQIDRSAINYFGYLIVLIVVVEGTCIEGERAIQQRVLCSNLKGIYEFRLEYSRMNRRTNLIIGTVAVCKQNSARWICSACFVSMRIRPIDYGLVGEFKFRRPICCKSASELIPHLIYDTSDRISPTVYQQLARNLREMFAVFGPPQTCS